jgi:hypothetical protein
MLLEDRQGLDPLHPLFFNVANKRKNRDCSDLSTASQTEKGACLSQFVSAQRAMGKMFSNLEIFLSGQPIGQTIVTEIGSGRAAAPIEPG